MPDDAQPRWLDDSEQQAWLLFAQVLMRLPSALESQMQRDAGIGHFEYLVLAGLSMAPGRRLRLKDVARLSGSSLTRLSNVVTKFERAGLVHREVDPHDGRSTFGVLTDAGLTVVEQAAPAHVEEVRRLVVDRLTDQQLAALGQACQAILVGLDPAAPTAPLTSSPGPDQHAPAG